MELINYKLILKIIELIIIISLDRDQGEVSM